MEDEAHGVVDPLVVTEGMVTALVSYYPNSGEDAALEGPIHGPCEIEERAGQEVKVSRRDVVEEEGEGEVLSEVGEGANE